MSMFSSIGKIVGGAAALPFVGPTIGAALGPIGTAIGGNMQRQGLRDIAREGSEASNPLAAPQRQQYQGQLAALMGPHGGADFLANDPTVQAQKGMIGDWAQANFAKSGNLPLNAITGSSQLANVFGQQYNQRIQDLAVLGGFNQGNPYGGQPFSATINPAAKTYDATTSAVGSLFGNPLGSLGGLSSLFGGGASAGAGSGAMAWPMPV